MSKRCRLGKSCGATCIERRKMCQEGMDPRVVASIGMLRKALREGGEEKSPPKKPEAKVIQEPSPKAKLSKLETTADFERLVEKGLERKSPELEAMHSRLGKLLGSEITGGRDKFSSPEEEAKFNELRKILFGKLKDSQEGEDNAKLAYDYMQRFMRSDYREIRNAQRGLGKSNPEMDRAINAIEKIISSSVTERPEVEKFRGKAVSPEVLAGMIASSKVKGSFKDGALASWTTNLAVSQMFANTGTSLRDGRDQLVILRTINKQGVPVNSIAPNKIEDEILTSGGAKYKYSGYRAIQAEGSTYHVFDVEEE